MSVRPNGLGASRSGWSDELDEETMARHRGFLDLDDRDHDRDRARRARLPASSRAARPRAHLNTDQLLTETLRLAAAVPEEPEQDEMETITKWPLVVGTLLAAIALLVGLGAIGALPFR
jgi:hypothetical protein